MVQTPQSKLISCTKEELPGRYQELLKRNPLLGRIEGECKTLGWTDTEIRTFQLVVAVASNASLQQRVQELEILKKGTQALLKPGDSVFTGK